MPSIVLVFTAPGTPNFIEELLDADEVPVPSHALSIVVHEDIISLDPDR